MIINIDLKNNTKKFYGTRQLYVKLLSKKKKQRIVIIYYLDYTKLKRWNYPQKLKILCKDLENKEDIDEVKKCVLDNLINDTKFSKW